MAEGMAVLVRWIQFLSATLLVGLFGFEWLIARPARRQAGNPAAEVLAALDAQLVALAAGALPVTGIAGVLDLWRQVNVAIGVAPWTTPNLLPSLSHMVRKPWFCWLTPAFTCAGTERPQGARCGDR